MTVHHPSSGRNICVLDDLFRSEANGMQSFGNNLAWLDGVLTPILRHLGGTVTPVTSYGPGHRRVDIAPVLQHFDLPAGQASWARLFDAEPDDGVLTWLKPYLDGFDMVVGFELPNILFRAICALGLPVMDIAFSPLRFLEDLCFDIRCSDPGIANLLAAARISEDEVVRNLSQIQASVQRRWGANAQIRKYGTTGLMLGQTLVDASLIEDGVVRRIEDYHDRIADWAARFDTIILKPHPHGPKKLDFPRLRQTGARLLTTDASPYHLFAFDNVTGAVAISSGSLTEARLFGLDTLQFLQPLRRALRTNTVEPVSSAFLTVPFWQALLDDQPLTGAPGRLPSVRQQMNSNWGYDAGYPEIRLRPVSMRDRLRHAAGFRT